MSLGLSVTGCDKNGPGTRGPGGDKGITQIATWPELDEPPALNSIGARDAAVVVAIEDYSSLQDVVGAESNGEDWYRFFTRGMQIPATQVVFLRRNEATAEGMKAALATAASRAQAGGNVWFVFIGHGAPSAKRSDDDVIEGVLAGWDTQATTESLTSRGLRHSEALEILETSSATPVLIFDACFSGQSNKGKPLVPDTQPVLESKIPSGQRSIVMTASGPNEYAGALPGRSRPAFSYLVLGALYGWGDTNKDGSVTAGEAVGYARDTMQALVKGRTQTPNIYGSAGDLSLVRGAGQTGPDLAALALTNSNATAAFETTGLRAPKAEFAETPASLDDIDITVAQLHNDALLAQRDEKAKPETKRDAWCALANNEGNNPYRGEASKLCEDWRDYTQALRDKEASMIADYDKVRVYLGLEAYSRDQKIAITASYVGAYQDLGAKTHPHLKAVINANQKLQTLGRATLPEIGETGRRDRGETDEYEDDIKDKPASKRGEVTYTQYNNANTRLSKYSSNKKTRAISGLLALYGVIGLGACGGLYASKKDELSDGGQKLAVCMGISGGVAGAWVLAIGIGYGLKQRASKIVDRYNAQQYDSAMWTRKQKATAALIDGRIPVPGPMILNGGGGVGLGLRF